MENQINGIEKVLASMTKKNEELWVSRVVPFDKGKKEKWIISLVNKTGKPTMNGILHSLKSINKVDKNSEYWLCEQVKKGKWMCTFKPKGARKGWNA
ncbi:MAG: hypothetical protein HY517_04895 [Candidatus Aenigmarchaeota archaeon]|nr:hypothetical protein [Candidatus Aenigmarchaeota archaeon]